MRILLPDNVTWEDRERVVLPVAVIWHGDAVEVDDATPKEQIAALEAALAAFDPQTPTARQVAAGEFRAALAGLDPGTATAAELLPALRALAKYTLARMDSEGET